MAITWHLVPRARNDRDAFGDEAVQLELACKQLEEQLRQRLQALVAKSLLLERALLDRDTENC